MASAVQHYLRLGGVQAYTMVPGLPGRDWMELKSVRIIGAAIVEVTISFFDNANTDLFKAAAVGNRLQGQLAGVRDGAVILLARLDDAIVESYSQSGLTVTLRLNCLQIIPERGSLGAAVGA